MPRLEHTGVAVMVRAPLRLEQVMLTPELEKWRQRGRLDIVTVYMPDDTMMTVIGHYAYPTHRWCHDLELEQLQLVQDIESWKMQHNVTRCVWAGDFNAQPTDKMYGAVGAHGVWHDTHLIRHSVRQDTYIHPMGSSVIDPHLCRRHGACCAGTSWH